MKCIDTCPLQPLCDQRVAVASYGEEVALQQQHDSLSAIDDQFEQLERSFKTSKDTAKVLVGTLLRRLNENTALTQFAIDARNEKFSEIDERGQCKGPIRIRSGLLQRVIGYECGSAARVERLADQHMIDASAYTGIEDNTTT